MGQKIRELKAVLGIGVKNTREHKARLGFIANNFTTMMLTALCTGTCLNGLLKYTGASTQANGVIGTMPIFACFFQIIGAALTQNVKREKRLMIGILTFYHVTQVLMFLLPVFLGATPLSMLLVVCVYSAGQFSYAMTIPEMNNWMMAVTPGEMRPKFYNMRERFGLLGNAIFYIIASVLMDVFENNQRQQTGFLIIAIMALIISVLDIAILLPVYKPAEENKIKMTWKRVVSPLRDRGYLKVILMFSLWQLAMQALLPYTVIYALTDMKLSYSFIGIVTICGILVRMFFTKYWTMIMQKLSWVHSFLLAMGLFIISQIVFSFMNAGNAAWIFIAYEFIISIHWSTHAISMTNIQYDNIHSDDKAIYIGVCNAVSGVIGFVMVLISSRLMVICEGFLGLRGIQVLAYLAVILSGVVCLYMKLFFHKKTAEKG